MRKHLAAVAMLCLFAPTAAAHLQDTAQAHAFLDGVLHPLTGLDHALAMIAVGIFGFSSGARAMWMLPVAFVAGMSTGVLSPIGTGLAPAVEIVIASSVVGLGALLALGLRLPLWLALASVTIAGVAHGAAHSMEGASSFSAFAAGALAMTALLHAAGAGIGYGFKQANHSAPRILGAGIAAAGALLTLGG